MKSDFERTRDKNIRTISKAIKKLQISGYVIEADTVENMIGQEVTHIYLKGRDNKGRIYEQKHLFTLDKVKQ